MNPVHRRPMIAGNWKMHLSLHEAVELVKAISAKTLGLEGVEILVAPPFTALHVVREAACNAGIFLGAQNMHWEGHGAFTGEISGGMLLEAGCTHVILGHSERRNIFEESDQMIDRKVRAAVRSGLVPIVCIGETLEERERGKTSEIVRTQLEGSLKGFVEAGQMPISTVLAYEPVWAIGTGKTATPEQAQEVHSFIREWIRATFGQETAERIRILYGGSVKADNINDLMARPDIDGALVGGASIKADSFVPIIKFAS